MAKKKKGKSSKRGWPRWLTFVLAGAALAGVMGAFDRLVNYDKQNNMVSGLFAAGVAIAAAYMLRRGKVINGAMAGAIGGLGIAYGAQKILGPKLYEIGGSIASSFSNMLKGTTQPSLQAPPTQTSSPGYAPSGSPGFTGSVPTGGTAPVFSPSGGLMSGAAPSAPAPAPAPAPASTTTIIQAPKISSSSYLLGKGIDALGTVAGALVGGLTGSKADQQVGMRRAFGRAA